MLKNIKRKATFEAFGNNAATGVMSNNPTTQLAPLMTAGQDFDVDRYNKDYHVFMQEVCFFNKQEKTIMFSKAN